MIGAKPTSPEKGIDILHAGRSLRRCYSVHRAILRTLGGWMVATPRFEDKYAFGYHLWAHAQHAQAVRQRLTELRGGLTGASLPTAFTELLDEAPHAARTEELIEGIYLELLPSLIREYEFPIRVGDRAANAPEISLARRILPDLEDQREWAADRVSGVPPSAWRTYIRTKARQAFRGETEADNANSAASAIVRPHNERFHRSQTIVVDSRLRRGGLLPYNERQALDYDQELIEQFRVYFNEFYAACILGSILFDASADLPLDFMVDVAHQCWDEVRHSEFGQMRLTELGVPPDRYDPILYEQVEGLPVMHRFCHLTRNLEPFFMPRKRPRTVQYEKAGDLRSRLFADIDWSDEINHVRYGATWMDWFLKDDARDVDDVRAEIAAHIERFSKTADATMSPF